MFGRMMNSYYYGKSGKGDYRKEDNPRITGYEYHILNLITYCCPKALILPMLRETAEELKTREPDAKKNFRARIVVVGSEMDDPEFTSLIEDSGALVVADRYCFGALPGRQEIVIEEGKVIESGTHRELIEKKGEYYRLANIQHQALKKRGLE